MPSSTSTSTQQLIDQVVREVLSRLKAGAHEHSASARTAADADRKGKATSRGRFTFADRVISVDSFAAVPAGVDEVLVEPSAVITPAARDLARHRGIALVRRGESPLPKQDALLIADTDSPDRAAGLSHQLVSRGVAATSTNPDAVLQQVQNGRAIGLVLSDVPAGFVCAACRNGSVRAAAISELNELPQIESQMQPNLWVIDMRRVSLSKAIVLAERCIRMVQQGGSS